MSRRVVSLYSPAIGAPGTVIVYGHWGRPLLAFPAEAGRATDWEQTGMVTAIEPLLDAGRVKLYTIDSFDSGSWLLDHVSLEERAQRHGLFEDWLVNQVVPFVYEDCAGATEIMVAGSSFGAYHAANFALRRADLFPLAICMSGVYDITTVGDWGRGDAVYFNNPAAYVANLHGDHLDWLRSRVSLLLVVGQGAWEDSTGALDSTRRFAGLLSEKGIRHELDIWGWDVPHDWPSWQRQLAHHLPRFC